MKVYNMLAKEFQCVKLLTPNHLIVYDDIPDKDFHPMLQSAYSFEIPYIILNRDSGILTIQSNINKRQSFTKEYDIVGSVQTTEFFIEDYLDRLEEL
jgi:hypothetical protein